MSFITNQLVTLENNVQVDSFNRLRTTEVNTLFDSPLKYHDESFLWDTVLTGTATSTYNLTERILDMTVSTNGDSVIRQTKEYFQLQTGKSHQGFVGCVFGPDNTNVTKKVGFFDDQDGFYLQYQNGTPSLVVRSSVTGAMTEIVIPQNLWDDRLDGTGASGITADFTKSQVLSFDISYTGFGRVRIGVLIGGKIRVCLSIEKANTSTTNGFSTPSLPVRYEIISTGGVSGMKQQASCVLIEGRKQSRGVVRAVDTGLNAITVSDAVALPVIAIRLRPENRKAKIVPQSFQILHTSGNSSIKYEVFIMGSVTGGSWGPIEAQSITEVNTTGTAHTGGQKIASGYLPAKAPVPINETFDSILSLTGNYDGTTHILAIVLTGLGNSAPTYSTLSFKEIY